MGLGNGEWLLVGKVIFERGETFPKLIVIKVAQLCKYIKNYQMA